MRQPGWLAPAKLAWLCLLAVAGCSPDAAVVSPPTRVALADTPQPQPTSTPEPSTAEATALPAPSRTAVPSPQPTATVEPSPTPCTGTGEVVAGSFLSRTAGGEQHFRLYYPPCYGQDGRVYPTLYLFAGNIHQEGKWDELGIDEAADAAVMAGESAPLLIVMTAGGWLADDTSGGAGSYESLVLDELIPHIEEMTCAWADARGRAIGGISRGGYWALEIAFRFPDLFTSVGGHSAALLDEFAGPEVNPQQTALTSELGDLRIYLDIGNNDFLRTNTIRLHEEMQAAGVAHEWRLNEGQHNDVYWSANTPDYLRWYSAPWPLDRSIYPLCSTD